jgi:hypothetical protein
VEEHYKLGGLTPLIGDIKVLKKLEEHEIHYNRK